MPDALTIEKTLEAVQTSGRTNANPETRVIREEHQWPIGLYGRQGDVMLRRLDVGDAGKLIAKAKEAKTRQIAPGNTQGSRHVVRENSARIYELEGADALTGPIVVAPEGFYLEHPTHADFDVSLPGCYQVTFPRDLAVEAQEEARRRAD
jgi:hypothetical protein